MLSPDQIVSFFQDCAPPPGIDPEVLSEECQAPLDLSTFKFLLVNFQKHDRKPQPVKPQNNKENVQSGESAPAVDENRNEDLSKNSALVESESTQSSTSAPDCSSTESESAELQEKSAPKVFQPKKSSVKYEAPDVEITINLENRTKRNVVSFDQIIDSESKSSELPKEVPPSVEKNAKQPKGTLFKPKKSNVVYEGADIPVDEPKIKGGSKKITPSAPLEEPSITSHKGGVSFADLMNSEMTSNLNMKKEEPTKTPQKNTPKAKFQPKKAQTFYIGPSVIQNERSINEYIESFDDYDDEEEEMHVEPKKEEPKEKKPSIIDILIEEEKRKASNNNKEIDNSAEKSTHKPILFKPIKRNNVYDGLKLDETENQKQKQKVSYNVITPDTVSQQPKQDQVQQVNINQVKKDVVQQPKPRFNPKKKVIQEQSKKVKTGPSFDDLLNQEQKISEIENKNKPVTNQMNQEISYGSSNKVTKKKTFSQLLNEASSHSSEHTKSITTTQVINNKNKSFSNLMKEEATKAKTQQTTTNNVYSDDDIPFEKRNNLKENLKKQRFDDEDFFWGQTYDDHKDFPTLREKSMPNNKSKQRMNEKQSKIKWLINHLSYEFGESEWEEIAETLISKSRSEMIRILNTFTSDPNQARQIVNAFFSKFEK